MAPFLGCLLPAWQLPALTVIDIRLGAYLRVRSWLSLHGHCIFHSNFSRSHCLLLPLSAHDLVAQEADFTGVDRGHSHNPWALGTWGTKPLPSSELNRKNISLATKVAACPFLGCSCSARGKIGSFSDLGSLP